MGLDQTAYIEKDDGSKEPLGCWSNIHNPMGEWMTDLFVNKYKEAMPKNEAEKDNSGTCLCRDCIEEIPFSVAECPYCKSKDIPKKVTCWNCKESFSEDDIEEFAGFSLDCCPHCGSWYCWALGALDTSSIQVELNEEDLDELSKFVESDPDFKQEADYNCPNGRMESVKQFIKEAKAALGKGHKVFYFHCYS